ncbi:MAG: PspC domain-containing protein [Prevotella sp.]|mgnify:CR=1 FL=1|jgi:phage shock protein C|nr:PspC domain-containing protein [Prevotella sp.]MCI2081422.1 PspC domain-containing protein [Prevotella sp.]MCI2103302.1 PspC domain-containing protein [Prevotella sp.]HCN53927.1 PspC domain-containing protein [Prevotella sp.]
MNKKLVRSSDRWLAGVCGGLADFFGFDKDVLRIIWLLLTIFTAGFPGILLYVALWILMPNQ